MLRISKIVIAAGGAPLILSTQLVTFKKRLMHRDYVNQVEASATGLISASPAIFLIPVFVQAFFFFIAGVF